MPFPCYGVGSGGTDGAGVFVDRDSSTGGGLTPVVRLSMFVEGGGAFVGATSGAPTDAGGALVAAAGGGTMSFINVFAWAVQSVMTSGGSVHSPYR